MKFLLAVIGFLAFSTFGYSFDSDRFLNRNCQNQGDQLVCDMFDFNQRDEDDIQKTSFIISNASAVIFRTCTIGLFNENLVNKFPNASVFEIDGCTFNMKSVKSKISTPNWQLTTLKFVNSNIRDNENSTALHGLSMLKEIVLRNNYLLSTVDGSLLAFNYQLKSVQLGGSYILSVNPDAFSALQNLRKLDISDTPLKYLSPKLLSSNYKIEEFIFANNQLEDIPMNFFPKELISINLSRNSLQVVSSYHFEGLRYLEDLDLSQNQIYVLSTDAFNTTRTLSTLDLHNNQIKRFHRSHFRRCLGLEKVHLYDNRYEDLPEDIFDDLMMKLEVAKVNNIKGIV